MSGRAGQRSMKASDVTEPYRADFLESMDGRVGTVKTLRQRFSALTGDLGGLANLSYQEQSLCKRIVHLERLIEKFELSLAHGGTVDLGSYINGAYLLRALFITIGLKRRVKVLSLKDYLRDRPSEAATPAQTKGDEQA